MTALADVLEAAGLSWRRYGYQSSVMMPRMFEILPDRLSRQLQRDTRAISAWAAAAAGASLVVPAAIALSLPPLTHLNLTINVVIAVYAVLITWRFYRAAVSAAIGYATRIDSAVDLYRFKLLEDLHLPLPSNLGDEAEARPRSLSTPRMGGKRIT